MKKFAMGAYGVDLTPEQDQAVQSVIENYNEAADNEHFHCMESDMGGFISELLVALDCVEEPEGGF